jgi:hypothetical protein
MKEERIEDSNSFLDITGRYSQIESERGSEVSQSHINTSHDNTDKNSTSLIQLDDEILTDECDFE